MLVSGDEGEGRSSDAGVTCAKLVPECRWDNENFVMLCPLHQSSKLPNEVSEPQKQSKRITAPKCPSQVRSSQACSNNWKWPSGSPQKWVLCCSALSATEKGVVTEFAKLAGVPISKSWSPSVTHVIASTDPSGACKRTLKFLMAILNGKWIVSIDWVKACMESMEPADEQKFEVTTDVHGVREGPKLGRQRAINKQPKLFNDMQFYLHGDYTVTYRGFLQDLVVAAGGTVLHWKPVSRDQQKLLDDSSPVIVVYSVENQGNLGGNEERRRGCGREGMRRNPWAERMWRPPRGRRRREARRGGGGHGGSKRLGREEREEEARSERGDEEAASLFLLVAHGV